MTSKKSKSVAFLLSTFLWAFGFHRFYVGKGGSGVVMIFFSATVIGLPITALWNFVDWLMILSNKFTDDEGNYLTKW